jgi:hypothetical protein
VLYGKPLQDYPAFQSKNVHSLRFGCLLKVKYLHPLLPLSQKKPGQPSPPFRSLCLAGVFYGFSEPVVAEYIKKRLKTAFTGTGVG